MLESHQFNPALSREFILENYDSIEYLVEVFNDFLTLMPDEIEEIKEARATKDKDKLAKKLHSISPAVGFVGGIVLSDRIKEFEQRAKNDPGFDVSGEESDILVGDIGNFIGIIQSEYNSLS